MASQSGRKRVAVIGAGPSGLIATKTCLEDGMNVVCFEITSDIGGLWNYDTALIEGKGSVMRSTVINSSKENMAFSDFPPPKEYPNYMHNRKLLDYFRLYAKQFNLYEKIKFRTKVKRIVQADNYDLTGQWSITYDEANTGDKTEIFDAVMVCIGHHAAPNVPIIETLNGPNARFKGEVIHSWQYRDPYKYIDKKVLVIGVGNSGGDIAAELGRIASQVYLSTRTGMHCIPRSALGGMPGDYKGLTRITNFITAFIPKSIRYQIIVKTAYTIFDHKMYGVAPIHNKEHHIFVNDDLPNRIASGTVMMKSNYKEFTETGCIFDDDSVVNNIDTVILCTGYKIGFPLFGDQIINVNNNWVNLYKYIFPPQLKHPSTIAVIGCIQPIGSINPIVELQCRWASRVFRGLSELPSKEKMERDIKYNANCVASRYIASQRHTIQVDFINYCDEIANLAGCKPNLLKYFITNPKLWHRLVFNGITPYQYRLNGPGARFELAKKLIEEQEERIFAAFKTRVVKYTPKKSNTFYYVLALCVGMSLYKYQSNILQFIQSNNLFLKIN